MTSPEKFITELDAAQILGLSVHQLRRARAKGGVPHARLNGRIVYLESALAEWQEQITEEGTKPCDIEAPSSSFFMLQNRIDQSTGSSTKAVPAEELLQAYLSRNQNKRK